MKFAIIIPMLLLAVSCIKPAGTSPRIYPADMDADYCLDLRDSKPVVRLVKKYRDFEHAVLDIPKKPYFDCEDIYITSAGYFYFFGMEEHTWIFDMSAQYIFFIDGVKDDGDGYQVRTRTGIWPVVQIDLPKSQFIALKKGRKKEDLLQFENKIIDAKISKFFTCSPYVDTLLSIKFRARITGECEQKKNDWSQPPWNIGATSEDSVFAEPGPDGTLAIGGKGKMMDFDRIDDSRPWLEMCNEANAKVVIDSGVTHIGDWAFRNCSGLASITIGSSVAFIYKGAFEGCEKLNSITVLNPAPPSLYDDDYWSIQEESTAFKGVNKKTCPLYVPEGSVDAYSIAYGWEEFYNIKPME